MVTDDGRLDGLAEGDLAQHWQVSARFLKAVLTAWPKRLDEMGLIDVSDRRVRLLNALRTNGKPIRLKACWSPPVRPAPPRPPPGCCG